MSQARRRQIARLEKLAGPKIEQARRAEEDFKVRIKNSATSHAIGLGALILYGNPKQDEPLSDAWQRCIEHFPSLQLWKVNKLWMSGEGYARKVADIVLEKVAAELPGTTKEEKIQNLFSSAPPWLIWFTYADFTGAILDVTLPDLSTVANVRRSRSTFEKWPALPDGKFEFRIRNDDLGAAERLSVQDAAFLVDMRKVPEEKMTRLDRKRYHSLFDKLIR
jgi:hypothetical protein